MMSNLRGSDAVELALAAALEGATKAGQWSTVAHSWRQSSRRAGRRGRCCSAGRGETSAGPIVEPFEKVKPRLTRRTPEDTVEEKIFALQGKKLARADAALGNADRAAAITKEELLALLE
jgi:hypothetical protein